MAYSIRLPDGTLVENIPDDLSPEEAKKRIIKAFPQFAPPTSVTRRVLGDVPVGIAQGATTGVRMIADAFGADNAVSQSLKGAEEYLGGLLSAQATNNLDGMAKILKEAEDKGKLEQVKAGAQALAEAPVEIVSQFLGTAAPTILAGVGGIMARLGATGIGALQAGTGATMGAGLIKGNIYEVVKEELTNAGVDPKISEERAKFAQNYTGENWDQILLGTGLGAAAALGPLERIFARVPAIPTGLAAKNMVTRGVAAGVMEAAPEATQAFQEQVAANIALQREGFDVPTFRGAVANATLEGLAGFGVGAPIGMMSRRQKVGEAEPGAEQRAEETKRTQEGIEAVPATTQEEGLLPGMVQPEPELTPEDEAELQARIAAVPPAAPPAAPPAGIAPILPPGPSPAPAPTGVPIPTEPSVTPQAAPPVAAPEPQVEQLEMLKAQLAQIQQARLDPTLSIDDYEAIEELDRRESEIFRQIQALTPQPPIVPTPVEQLPEIDNVAKQQPAPAVALQQPAPLPAPPAAPAITPPPAVTPPTAPPVTPPAAVTPQVVPPIETPTEVRDQRTVQTELNRVRQSLRQMETAVRRGQMPESEVTRLQDRVNALEQELEQARPTRRVPVFRSKEGNTWTGTGGAPAWLRKKLDQGMDLEDFRIRPELDNKSEDEIGEMEKPYGFGRPMPETRPPKELEDLIAQSEEARKESPNLFNMLRGKITPEDVEDITPEANLNFLKAPRGRGRDLSDVVNDGTLDAFLEVPHNAPNFDLTEATEFIKDLLRQDFKEDPTLMMSQETRAQLEYFGIKISELEAELEPEDVNRELQAVYAEERAIAQETEAAALEEQERGPAVPTGPPEFALEGETLEQSRARAERAEAEREEFERRRVADLERDVFALQPTPAAPTPPPAAPPPAATGDLFGAAGMADQPPRTAPTVAPTPIEAEAAKIPPIKEAIEAELKKAGYDDLTKMSKQIKDEFGVSKPVADAYARAVQNARIQHVRAQYGEITAEQLMEALNTRDSLRRRIDGIVKRLEAAKPREGRPVEVQTWDVFYTGTSNLAAENVEAPSAQKAKEIAAEKEGLKSIARLTAKKKEKRIKTEAAPTEKGKFTLAKDGIDGFEIEPSRVPDGNDAFQYAVGRDLNRVTFGSLEGVFRRRADERGTYGGWRYLTRVDKLIPEKSEPKKEEKPSIRPTREIAEGTVVERIELPDNLEIRIVKLKDGYSVYQYDLDADEIVFGQQRQFRAPAFPKDRDAYRAADAYADEMYDQIVPKMAPGELKKFVDQKLSRGKDVINNKTPDPDIPPDQRLVLMSCCATKKGRAGEAMELYTGVFFQTFKNKVRPDAMPNVRILSAKYGFLKPDQRITTYDQTMNEETANQFLMGDNLVEGFPSNIKDVLIVGSNEYQRVMKAAIEDLIKEGKIDKGASINVTKGGIGEQRSQLGRYLAALRPAKEAEAKPEAPKVSESIGRAYQNASGMIYGKTWTNSLNNQHRARLGARLRDEGYTEREAKDIVEEAVKVQSDRRLPQMDFLQLRDLLIAGKTLGLEEAPSKKPEPKKEQPAGPTFAGMQAEIDRVKAEAKAMGIDLDQQTFVRDEKAAKAEREAKKKKKEAKLVKQATRNEIEYARFDDLNTDPIQATPEQLKLAKQLADSVNGELVFYDKDLNLGLVTVANKMGFDDYFPIHDGIISKVDVSDYTGLSVMDKSFLKRIKNSLEILKGTSGRMLAGTEEEQKGIRAVAEYVGGTPVYFDPKRNVGLVRGYGALSGDPIYAISIGSQYSTADVENTTNLAFLPYKSELIAVKKRLEEEAAKKHQDDPFIKFDRGISLSDGIDSSFKGIITEWKSMLGLDNVNIYFSTIEDARKNRDNFTGPHRSIGSGTLDANEAGSMRRMADGSYYVLFKEKISKSKMLETIAHEIGHVHEREAYRNAPQDLKNKLQEAHAKWLQQRKGKTAREAVDMLRAKTSAQQTPVQPGAKAEQLTPYWSSFSEWYADQVSRWAVTDEKPVGVVEKFFARLGAALRRFYQTLKGQRYLPDETFVQYLNQVKPVIVETIPGPVKEPVQIEMSFQMQKDLFGSTSEAKQIGEIMEVKGKKLPPGRSPELAAAASAVQAGTMSAEEYNKLVDVYKPIQIYAEPLKPATAEQVFDALDVKKREQINPQIPNGTKVGLRLDIPAFNRKGVFVVSIHQKRTASAPGKVIGYGSVAKAKNVTFGVGNQLKALEIAAGAAKDALQTIEGEYVNVSPEQAFAEAQRAIKDPSYVQVGIDPTRHAYFYDRRTTLPVVSAEEVIQIGNMILAKNPTFGKKADFLYNIEGGPIAGDTQPDDASFFDRLRKEESEKREIERQEKIAYYTSIRRKEVALQQRVRDYGSTLETQRQLNNLSQIAQTLKEDIDLDKPRVYTAESFLRQARAAVDGAAPYKEQAISPDVFAVIQAVYMDDPRLLEGLRLSIKPEFSKKDEELRRAFGIRGSAGAFWTFERIVNLYTGTKGVTDPLVIRHELTHTLEQMMTGTQRMAIFNSYMDALKKAIKKNKDPKAQEFFDNVLKFLDKPTEKNKQAVNSTLPSYALYQFVNPSEYWAVNAEKLMAQRLGTQWDRFKKAVRKMFEKMKDIFGFNNQFAVHDVFDKIMSGSKERLGRDSIAAYIASSGEQFEFLNSIKEDSDLIAKYGHGDTPMLDVAPAKRIMLKTAQNAKESFKEMVENPSEILRMTFNPLVRGITYLRNKNIWFGTGLNEADRIRYNGQVRTAEGLATASLALDNMIRGGNIATQVLFQGGIEYNPNTLMFGAVKKEKNMTKVYEAEAALKKKLGDQLGTNIIQGYLVAKRSKNIKDDVEYHEMALENVNEDIDLKVQELKSLDANPNATEKQKKDANRELRSLFAEAKQIQKDYDTIKKIAEDKVTMSDTEIEDFIAREKVHPELKEILNNFTAVNQNLLKFWRQVGLLSQPRYERLAGIKDYVPWYRIMADEEDVHSPIQATTRSATNIGKEKLFGPGKPSVVDDFVIEENQNVFKIQPAKVNAVKLNSKRLKPEEYEINPQGEMTLKVPYKPGDILVIQSERQIENIIDNMTRNVMRMTMNGLRQYAAQRIVSEYATRGADGKILTFNKADPDRGRFDFINNGRRTVVEIQDPLITEAALGMQTVGMQMWKPLAAAANFTRRTITLSPVFQVRQVFKDAPTAALVTGVKNPAALVGGVYKEFISALRDSDPASSILRSAGIGGFYSPARTPEADVKRQIGIINNSTYDYVIKALDHVGDSSDIAQRIAIYNRVMAETGDEALALYQSANVINFLRHGSGQVAQALVQTVPFLNAYAQSIDVLYNALVGGGLRGLDRKKAMQRLFVTGSLLAGTTILYAMLVGDDDEYMKMDDQSKIRNYMIPGTDVILPMNTSAAFFFKAIPELVYNKVVNEGTENAIDEKRLRTALKEAAVDLLLGPTPIPSAVKPVVEISLNRDFFTSRPVVPAGLQDLDAYQQYDMRTSDAGKLLSALTGTEANRLLNPIEADHLIRGIFGTVGGMVAWSSNLIGTSADYRPEMGLKEMPITGPFLRPPVPRGREDLFYALKESTDQKYKTFNRLVDRDPAEAEAYLNRHPNLIAFYDYTSKMDVDLKEINAAIRFIGEIKDPSYTPEQKRKEILELMNLKQEILEGVEQFRREAYAD